MPVLYSQSAVGSSHLVCSPRSIPQSVMLSPRLMLRTHEKKGHQQRQLWGKGVGNEVLQQATIANTILV